VLHFSHGLLFIDQAEDALQDGASIATTENSTTKNITSMEIVINPISIKDARNICKHTTQFSGTQ